MVSNRYVSIQPISARKQRVSYAYLDTDGVKREHADVTVMSETITCAVSQYQRNDIRFVGVITENISFPENTITTFETLVGSNSTAIDPKHIYEWPNGLWSTEPYEQFNASLPAASELGVYTWVFVMTPDNQSKYEQLLSTMRSSTIKPVDNVSYTTNRTLVTRSFVSICYELHMTMHKNL